MCIDRMCECSLGTEGEIYQLRYKIKSFRFDEDEMTENTFYYGVGIDLYQKVGLQEYTLKEKAFVKGFSESYMETVDFLETLCAGKVFPVSLEEIVDDWKCGGAI